ncbi:MAG: GGDEF domain-containing protein [Humidesulfovibrio sp.]|uniref:GGDEF domain-containing protein n=1 Tax=Humidesulfovibrio sp. TaxID=2910988 RepID=UPI0027ECD33B|nr:GGDEF domain-containing protein [Humidesulfovibrio sp.]MDQ7836291.1 GGDEF domain-containing protein [Humidesulfovibrio sp.]
MDEHFPEQTRMWFSWSQTLYGRLTLRYCLALGMVAVLILLGYWLERTKVHDERLSEYMFNLAARQRMLTQRVEVLLLRAMQAKADQQVGLLREHGVVLDQYTTAHEQLLHGPARDLGMTENSLVFVDSRNRGTKYDALAHEFISLARVSAEEIGKAGSLKSPVLELERLTRLGDDLLASHDMLVKELQDQGTVLQRRRDWLLAGISLSGLATLLASGLFLFRPMAASVAHSQASLEAMNIRLQEQATCDPLTGAYNRRYWAQVLPHEMARAGRQNTLLCLIMVDLDHFKHVNDTYGHPRGDQVLKELAKRLRKSVRATDTLFRLGGEEFAVLMPGTDLEQGGAVAEKLRVRVAAQPMAGDLEITASFGVSITRGQEPQEDFICRADEALYAAKTKGRNRVETA